MKEPPTIKSTVLLPRRWPVVLWEILLAVNILMCFLGAMAIVFAEKHELLGMQANIGARAVLLWAVRGQFVLLALSCAAMFPLGRTVRPLVQFASFLIPLAGECLWIWSLVILGGRPLLHFFTFG